MRRPWRAAASCAAAIAVAAAAGAVETERTYLSGLGKDDPVPWEFRCTAGRRCGGWTTIPVPSNWELAGFGAYNYGHDQDKSAEEGHYRRRFTVPESWRGGAVFLVFEGVMTDAEVRLNGALAGPAHRGGFYPFRYEVGERLRWEAENLLEVAVRKRSADRSVERAERDADYWVFGGIYRPVYLEAHPAAHIDDVAIDARAAGSWHAEVDVRGAPAGAVVRARVLGPAGVPLGEAVTSVLPAGAARADLRGALPGAASWSAETPVLHQLEVELAAGARILHRIRRSFGFRTVELRRGDGLFVNGRRVRLKGINRHSFWPDSGRATSPAVSRLDAALIKGMSLNAVRTAHYPPDSHFLDACDRQGLYVLDELAGWHHAYSTAAGAPLVEALVRRDRNHPSVIAWTNGNEGGWNPALDPRFSRFDPQRRPVLHPRADFGGVDTRHYPDYATLERALAASGPHAWLRRLAGRSRLVMPTELLHGLYDGGGGASLADYWDLMRRSPAALGGFLWSLFDEAVMRSDRGDALDADGSHGPDGVLGPYREPEASAAAIRAILAPVMVTSPEASGAGFDGRLTVENRQDALDLSSVSFAWELLRFPGARADATGHRVVARGTAAAAAPPGATADLRLDLPPRWRSADALRVRALDADGAELGAWHFALRSHAEVARATTLPLAPEVRGATAIREGAERIVLSGGDLEVALERASGRIAAVRAASQPFALSGGPRILGTAETGPIVWRRHESQRGAVIEARGGGIPLADWRLDGSGWLRLRYRLAPPSEPAVPWGVGFDYPEAGVRSVRFLGGGPQRVWRNRRAGALLDVWEKPYNDTATGLAWVYPEFKGYHDDPYWVDLRTDEGRIVIVLATSGLFAQLFRPAPWPGARGAAAAAGAADLAFLHDIPAIGTKFHAGAELGPAGRGEGPPPPLGGELWFRFVPAATGGGRATGPP